MSMYTNHESLTSILLPKGYDVNITLLVGNSDPSWIRSELLDKVLKRENLH